MKFHLHRDQAVWEREYLSVTIPDDTPEDEIKEAIQKALAEGNCESLCTPSILDIVDGLNSEICDIEKQEN